ncbi:MAG: hypothetical protein ACRDJH_04945 [Thermomicrobiales bacterium]
MTVFVESNFVIELALGQEQLDSVEALLRLAERAEVDLAIPIFALSEPFGTILHRGRERGKLIGQIRVNLRELERSRPHHGDVARLQPMPDILSAIEQREDELLDAAVGRLLGVTRGLNTAAPTFELALQYKRQYGLATLDAIIYATVIDELTRLSIEGGHYFVSKNARDFDTPGIRAHLKSLGCTFVASFDEALRLVRPAES